VVLFFFCLFLFLVVGVLSLFCFGLGGFFCWARFVCCFGRWRVFILGGLVCGVLCCGGGGVFIVMGGGFVFFFLG